MSSSTPDILLISFNEDEKNFDDSECEDFFAKITEKSTNIYFFMYSKI